MLARQISAIALVRKLLMVCIAQSYEHARYPTSRVSEPLIRRDLHCGRYGLNPDVRPYRGTDHIRARNSSGSHARPWAERNQAISEVASAATNSCAQLGHSSQLASPTCCGANHPGPDPSKPQNRLPLARPLLFVAVLTDHPAYALSLPNYRHHSNDQATRRTLQDKDLQALDSGKPHALSPA